MSDERRIHVLVNDEESLAWLRNQKNMSASIRLLIRQIANSGNMNDYVMHCAEQAPSPFNAVEQSSTTVPVDNVISNEIMDENTKPVVEDEITSFIPEPEPVIELAVEDIPKESIPDEPEVVDEPEIIEEEEIQEDTIDEDVYWEQEEDEKQSRIARMMQDLENKQNSN